MTKEQLNMTYSLGNIDEIISLDEKTKETLLLEILGEISNDKNSSTFREGVTLGILGVSQNKNKLGYDSDDEPIEVKPKNLDSTSTTKFNGSGNFSDFTWKRHQKYKDDDVKMAVSGFYNGKLIFLVTFKYNSESFTNEIERQIKKHLPDGDKQNSYVRSVKFSYKHYESSDSLKVEYITPDVDKLEHMFTKNFLNMLKNGIK